MFEEITVWEESEWLNLRSTVLTASDIAVIMGLNGYRSVADMMGDKAEPKSFSNAYTWMGIALEPVVVLATNKVLDRNFKLYEDLKGKSFFIDKQLRLGATPDAYDDIQLLECKSTKPFNFLRYSGWAPIYYLSQLYTQLICTNKESGLLAILSTNLSQSSENLNIPIHIFELKRDIRIDDMILQEVKRFWETIGRSKIYRVNRKQVMELELMLRIKSKRIY